MREWRAKIVKGVKEKIETVPSPTETYKTKVIKTLKFCRVKQAIKVKGTKRDPHW